VLADEQADLFPVVAEGVDGGRLVLGHQAAVADHVGREDRGEPAFDAFGVHGDSGAGNSCHVSLHERGTRWEMRRTG
jgi:hypothetical protein